MVAKDNQKSDGIAFLSSLCGWEVHDNHYSSSLSLIDPFLILELIENVASHLDRHHILQLVGINKLFHQVLTPFLFHEVRIEERWSSPENDPFNAPEIEAAFSRYHQHIRTLHIRTLDTNSALQVIVGLPELNLTTLSIRAYFPTSLYLENAPKEDCVGRLLETIARALPRLQELESFTGDQPFVSPRVAREFFETCSSELEVLSQGSMFYDEVMEDEWEAFFGALSLPVEGTRPHPKLKSFSLRSYGHEDEPYIMPAVLSTFLRWCHSLEVVDDFISYWPTQ
ncbi:hypothetical protein BGX23_011687 [Mortierella sp. AD031]|nr:hypothetical protein BGX23_011687 [Mortierella sp. AD031]